MRYRRQPGPLAVTAGDAQVLADAVADMLVSDPTAYAAASDPARGGGWSARANVHQAAGTVAARLGTSIADALALLRSYAFATNSRLPDVARGVVESRLDLSPRLISLRLQPGSPTRRAQACTASSSRP